MKYVLLLRAPEEGGPDRYEVAFEGRGYVPLSVPVLETVLVHVDELRDKIARGPDAEGLSGVILTSKRAVEAWCEALRSIVETTQGVWYVMVRSARPHARALSGLADGPVLCRRGSDGGGCIDDSHRVPVYGASRPRGCAWGRRRGYGGAPGGVYLGRRSRAANALSDGGQESGDPPGDAHSGGYCASDARGVSHDGVVYVSG